MALRAGAFPEKLGHSACSQPACVGKDWCNSNYALQVTDIEAWENKRSNLGVLLLLVRRHHTTTPTHLRMSCARSVFVGRGVRARREGGKQCR
jgi:hypothetical protein